MTLLLAGHQLLGAPRPHSSAVSARQPLPRIPMITTKTQSLSTKRRRNRQVAPRLAGALLSGALGCVSEVQEPPTGVELQPLVTDPLTLPAANPKYFTRGGRPTIFAGPGGPEDFLYH